MRFLKDLNYIKKKVLKLERILFLKKQHNFLEIKLKFFFFLKTILKKQ